MHPGSVFYQASDDDSATDSTNSRSGRGPSELFSLKITTTAQAREESPSTLPGPLLLVKVVSVPHGTRAALDSRSSGTGGGMDSRSATEGSMVGATPLPDPVRETPLADPRLEPPAPAPAPSSRHGSSAAQSEVKLSPASATRWTENAKIGSSVRTQEQMAYSGPLRAKPLVPENVERGKGGVAAPKPLASVPVAPNKSHLRAAPTGGSDSDTDDDGGGSDGTSSAGSPGRRRTAEEDEEDAEEERRFVDEFGFVIDEDQKDLDEKFVKGIDGKQAAGREIKWTNMASNWDRTNTRMHGKLKERCRKGIPNRLRGFSWQLLIGSHADMVSPENVGVYIALRDKKLRDSEIDEVLGRDLSRTFPNHVLFRDEGGVGQTFLRNVLHAYAGCDPEVGYTQGMAFVVGTLSTQVAEEECFWALHTLMYHERYRMRELYKPGFPLLHQFFYQLKRLIARLLPKLSKRFNELEIEPSFYASQWFMTLFVYHFPFRALLRIWDIFFSEGWKIVFRTGIALMKWEEKRLLAMSFDELLPALKALQDGKDAKELVRRAHRIKFKTAELNRYGDEYWASQGTTLDG